MRKFHINQFPQDRVFILLEESFHKKLFERIHKNYSFEQLNTLFQNKLNKNTYKKWRYRMKKPRRDTPQFIPIWFVVRISKLPELNINEIEKKIIAYKGPSSSSIIWKPNLPLKEDGRLLKILAHLLGDGHADGAFGTKLPKGKSNSNYGNCNDTLLNQFKKDLQIFGEVHTSQYDHGNGAKSVIFPNLIGYILEHIYKIKTDTFGSKIPKILFKLQKKVIAQFIRAFIDDEGHVFDSSIEVYSNNKILILGILKLIKKKFKNIKISKLKVNKKAGKNIKYSFSILSDSLNDYRYLIGFDHPQKAEDLNFNINRQKLRKRIRNNKGSKKFIKKILKEKNLTAKQISRRLFISHVTVLDHLNKLKKLEEVTIISKGKHNENIWSLAQNLKDLNLDTRDEMSG